MTIGQSIIRLGCQLLRNFHLVKKELKKNDTYLFI